MHLRRLESCRNAFGERFNPGETAPFGRVRVSSERRPDLRLLQPAAAGLVAFVRGVPAVAVAARPDGRTEGGGDLRERGFAL